MLRRAAGAALARGSRALARELDSAALARGTLVIAPHPDDETLGCGGTIAAKRAAGTPVTIAYLTDGSRSHEALMDAGTLGELRRSEGLAAAAALGVEADHVVFMDFDDGTLPARREALFDALAGLLAAIGPEQVIGPCPWETWGDHCAASEILAGAVGAATAPIELLEYPIWFWDRWPWTSGHRRGRFAAQRALVDGVLGAWRLLSGFRLAHTLGPSLAVKRAALACHRSQTTRLIDDPRWKTLDEVRDGRLLEVWLGPRELFRRRSAAPIV